VYDPVKGRDMGEWIAIAQWDKCLELARPGIIFEISNAEGKSLFTPCVMPLPPVPFDWKSAPVRFRAIPQSPPQHSSPLPEPPKGER
jgi:hypothetical protein